MNDLRLALRSLRKSPGFTAVAVLTLALGIGANTAIFSVVNGVMLRPLPFQHPERLVLLQEASARGGRSNTSFATYRDIRDYTKTLQWVAAVRDWQPTLNGVGDAVRLPGVRVSADFFQLLGVSPALGRDFTQDEDQPDTWHVAMLSYGLWQQRFGGRPDIVGRTILLDNLPFTVIGVMPQAFTPVVSTMLYQRAQIWAPVGYSIAQPWACRECRHLNAVARVRADVSLAQARAEVNGLSERLVQQYPDSYPRAGMFLTPLRDQIAGPVKTPMLTLLAAVGFLLLMACAKVANLSLVRAVERQRELAVRGALGAGRWDLVRRLLAESLMIGGLGGAAGFMLAIWGTDLLLALAPAGAIPRAEDIGVDGRVLAFTLGLSLLTAIVFGIIPALQGSSLDLNNALKEGLRVSAGPARSRFRSAMVVVNLAIALVLLAGAGLALKSFARLARVNPGFDPRDLLTMQLSANGPRYRDNAPVLLFFHQVADNVRALSGVQSVALASQIPLGGNIDMWGITIDGRPWDNPARAPYAERYGVTPDYFSTMGVPLRRGRGFTQQDGPDAPSVVIINEAFARALFAGEDAIGKRIQLGGGPQAVWRTIVGVVGDVHHENLEVPPPLQAYVPFDQSADSFLTLVIRGAGDPSALAAPATRAVWAVDKDQPVANIATMEQLLARTLSQRRFTMTLLAGFAVLALGLAIIGIYSVMAYAVAQRTHEIGVRIALGALRGDVVRLVVREGGSLVALGVVIGLAGAAAVSRGVRGVLYDVSPTDPAILALVTTLLAAAGLLACYVPARRATRVDPMVALRHE